MQSLSVQLAPFSGEKPGLRPTASGGLWVQGTPKSWYVPLLYVWQALQCMAEFWSPFFYWDLGFFLWRGGWGVGGYIHCTCFLTSHIKAIVLMLELKPLTSPARGTITIAVWLGAALGHYPEGTQGTGGVQVQFYFFFFLNCWHMLCGLHQETTSRAW